MGGIEHEGRASELHTQVVPAVVVQASKRLGCLVEYLGVQLPPLEQRLPVAIVGVEVARLGEGGLGGVGWDGGGWAGSG